MTIEELQKTVDEWIRRYGVRYFDPLTNLAQLTEEVGETARIISRRFGEQSAKRAEDITDERLADELADVLWVVVCLANQTGLDLTEAVQRNIEKKTGRDRNRHKNNPKLNS